MSKRVAYFDVARAIAVVCVVAGHTFAIDSLIHDFCFTFELPLFFLTSGYFTNPARRLDKQYVSRLLRTLMLPYVATCAIIVCIAAARGVFLESESAPENVRYWVLASLWGGGDSFATWPACLFPPIGAIWFLPALFFVRVMLVELGQLDAEWKKAVAVVGIFAAGYLSTPYFWLPMSMQSAMVSLPFAYVGQLARTYDVIGRLNQVRGGAFAWLALFAAFALLVWRGGHMYLNVAVFGDGILTGILGGVVGSLCILQLSRWICDLVPAVVRPLEAVGQSTLPVFCMHLVEMTSGLWSIPAIGTLLAAAPHAHLCLFLARLVVIAVLCLLLRISPLASIYYPQAK